MTDVPARHRPHGQVSIYDPERGLKNIATAEAGELYFARAKDEAGLAAAVEEKLTAQRDYIIWRDSVAAPAHRPKNSSRPERVKLAGDPGDVVAHRWRRTLKAEADFSRTLDKARERCTRICEQRTGEDAGAHVGANSGDNEWFTPRPYIDAAREVMGGIDLDPASSAKANTVVNASSFFTREQDGLGHSWWGRVWLNPPYAQPAIEHFADKLTAEYGAGRVTQAVVLVNNASETAWFQTLGRAASALCQPIGRVRFWHPDKESAAPLQGQSVLYLGVAAERFAERFAAFGLVWVAA